MNDSTPRVLLYGKVSQWLVMKRNVAGRPVNKPTPYLGDLRHSGGVGG